MKKVQVIRGDRSKIVEKDNRTKAKKYRGTVCVGCRNNYYNYQAEGDGWNAPTSGMGCWHLDGIKRGKCPLFGD